MTNNYQNKYSELINIIGNTLQQLELNTDMLMHNAAIATSIKFNINKSVPTTEELQKFSRKINVSNIYIANNNGDFIRSTKEPPSLLPNIFSFCSQYKIWLKKGVDFPPTGIIISMPSKIPYKFYMLPTNDKKYLIEIGMEAKFIGNILSNAINSDKNIQSIEIISPTGKSLGKYNQNGDVYFNNILENNKKTEDINNNILISKKVEAVNQYCCSCIRNGITVNNKFYYIVHLIVSNSYIKNYQHSLTYWLSFILFVIIIITAIISHFISKKLVSRLNRINLEFLDIAKNELKNKRVHIDGSDEISEMAHILNDTIHELQNKQLQLIEVEKEAAKVKIAKQVAHDIHSPITALEMLSRKVHIFQDSERITLRNAVQRIRDIANNLLQNHTQINSNDMELITKKSIEFIPDLIHSVLSEVRILYQDTQIKIDLNIEDNCNCCFSKLIPGEFKRVMSNLLNNAVESIGETHGSINIQLSCVNSNLHIDISDTGNGIDMEYIPMLLSGKPFSIGKKGTGMGLSHAVNTLKEWFGSINITSKKNIGTTVTISLPMLSSPSWFLQKLLLKSEGTIVVLDDEPSIHEVWKERLIHQLGSQIHLISFDDPKKFIEWFYTNKDEVDLFFIDHEFINFSKSGLNIIEELNIIKKSCLVSSCFGDYEVKKVCIQLNVKIIPKFYVNDIPIEIVNKNIDLIFIDDDNSLLDAWSNYAKDFGKQILTFNNPITCLAFIHYFDKSTPIYIDSDLADGIKGEAIARQFFDMGYTELFLATGYNACDFPSLPWIKAIIGKKPPF